MHEHQFLDYPDGRRCPCGLTAEQAEQENVDQTNPPVENQEQVQEQAQPETPEAPQEPEVSQQPEEASTGEATPQETVAEDVPPPAETHNQEEVLPESQAESGEAVQAPVENPEVDEQAQKNELTNYFTRMCDDTKYVAASLKEFVANNGEVPESLKLAINNLEGAVSLIEKTSEVMNK